MNISLTQGQLQSHSQRSLGTGNALNSRKTPISTHSKSSDINLSSVNITISQEAKNLQANPNKPELVLHSTVHNGPTNTIARDAIANSLRADIEHMSKHIPKSDETAWELIASFGELLAQILEREPDAYGMRDEDMEILRRIQHQLIGHVAALYVKQPEDLYNNIENLQKDIEQAKERLSQEIEAQGIAAIQQVVSDSSTAKSEMLVKILSDTTN